MHETESPAPANVVLTREDAAFLAARLRRLFQHFGMLQHLPKDAVADDGRLIGIAGSAIGLLLCGRTDGVPAAPAPDQYGTALATMPKTAEEVAWLRPCSLGACPQPEVCGKRGSCAERGGQQ